MEIQTAGSKNMVQQQPQLQPSPSSLLAMQSSWYNLTLNQVQNQLGDLGKPVQCMNLDELLKYISLKEETQNRDLGNATSSSSLQHQASLTLARALSCKTVDQMWHEIQQGQMKRYGHEMGGQDKFPTLGETTLEDFLVQAGLFADTTITPCMVVDPATPQSFPQQMGLSSSNSIGALSDATTSSGWKRDAPDDLEKTMDRRLKRKIKNRESAARSRARKQAYHNELVDRVSHLQMENVELKKEKELDERLPWKLSPETRYQLRRTSSASF